MNQKLISFCKSLLMLALALILLIVGYKLLQNTQPLKAQVEKEVESSVEHRAETNNRSALSSNLSQPSYFGLTDGPGLGQTTFPADDLFQVISRINADNGAPRSHGAVSMHNGYLVVIFAIGGGRHDGGFAFFDISDPYDPQFVSSKDDDETHEIREAHGYGYSSSYGGDFEQRDLVALQARQGVQIWDWTDVITPTQVSYLKLPDISGGDYTNANWWTFWQAPYIYIAGADSGIYIIDASDPANPEMVNRLPNGETGGFRVGSLYAIGNLLVIAGNDVPGYATLDISDPVNPKLLDSTVQGPENYSVLVNGNRIFGAARFKELYAHDISDPRNIQQVGYFKGTNDKGGYLSYQDGFIHMGASVNYAKIDVRDENEYKLVELATSGIADRDEDFATVLGNFVVLGDDHENGSFLIPHESEPDTTGPTVNMVSPSNGSLNQLPSTRIGLTFSDLIDLRSVNTTTVQIRRVDSPTSSIVLSGTYSSQTAIVNFAPAVPLQADSVYEIYVPNLSSVAETVLDVAGNPVSKEFRSYFSTGSAFSIPPSCELSQPQPIELGETALFNANTLTGIGTITYTWDFGDESPSPPPSPREVVSYTYPAVGHYTVRAEAANGDGSDTCVTQAIVHYPLDKEESQRSSTIILSHDGSTLWNVNPDNDTVTATEAEGYGKKFEVAVGQHPRTLGQASDGTIWVVNQADATIHILSDEDGALLEKIILPYGSQPYGILFHSPSTGAEVANVSLQAAGKIVRIDVGSRSVVAELSVGPMPRGLALSSDGSRLFVGRLISPVDRGEVIEVNTASYSVERTLVLGRDPGPDTESSGRGVPNALGQLGISPDGRRLWVPAKKDNISRGFFSSGETHGFDSTVRTIAAQVDLEKNLEDPATRHDFENSDRAVAVAFTKLGDYVFVALQGSNAVAVLDAYSGQMVTQLPNSGLGPNGLALNDSGDRLFVHSFLSRSIQVYNVPGLLAGDQNARQPLHTVSTVANEKLTDIVLQGKRIFYNAEDARMNQDGYISCATCHIDGGEDGRVWDRGAHGEGLRNTISLLGRGGPTSGESGHGRIHWSGNFDEIQDFEHDMRTTFGGQGFLADEDFETENRSHPLGGTKAGLNPELDALAAYVSSLTEVPNSPFRNGGPENNTSTLTSQAINGKLVFQRLNCGSCHGGPNFTDSGQGILHDIGTIQATSGSRLGQPLLGIDTPTLRGLWESAPFLHNGSAPTLKDLLIALPMDSLHGQAAALESADQDDLIAYLLQLDQNESGPPLPERAIQITYPTAGERFSTSELITIRAETAKPLSTVQRVEFYVDGVLIGADNQPPYQAEWQSPDSAEEHLFMAAAKVIYPGNTGSVNEVGLTIDSSVPTRTPMPTPAVTATPEPLATPGGQLQEATDWVYLPLLEQ